MKRSIKEYRSKIKKLISFVFLLTLLLNTPFIVLNIIYLIGSNSCLSESLSSTTLTLKSWLIVDSISKTILILINCLIFTVLIVKKLISENKEKIKIYVTGYVFLVLLWSVWGIAWIMVGMFIFWEYLDTNCSCSEGLINYLHALMMAELVTVFVSCCGGCFGIFKSVRSLMRVEEEEQAELAYTSFF